MAGNDKLKEAIELLGQQARLQQEMNGSLEGYLDKVKEYSTIQKTIVENTKIEAKLKKELADATSEKDIRAAIKKIKILKQQTKELRDQGVLLDDNLKQVNKGNLVMAKGFSSAVKIAGGLPTIFKDVYTKIKTSGLFEMDKSMKKSVLQMGLLSKESDGFRSDIKEAAKQTIGIGVGVEDLAKIQGDYSDELGRTVMMSKEGLVAMGKMAAATGLGAEGTAKMAADMENQGLSAERTGGFVEQTMNDAHKMGLNASKVVKNIQRNIKMLNKYNFKGGIKGLAKMAETTTKLGVDMNFVGSMADKLFDIEGAVDMSAQLQVMGGAWAKLADPFKLMYMARNDMEGLAAAVGDAAESSVHFNKQNGEFEISALEMHRLRKVAEQTGVAYEDIATAGKNAAKFTKIKTQLNWNIPKEDKEFLTNKAFFDDNGNAKIEVDGSTKFLNQLTDSDKKLIHAQVIEHKSMEERAKASRTFDDALTNSFTLFKTAMLPLIESFNTTLLPKIDNLVKRFQDGKWGEKIAMFGEKIGKLIEFFGGWVLDNPIKSAFVVGGGMLIKALAGGILEKANWVLNGLALSKGFQAGNMGGGGIIDSLKGVFGKGAPASSVIPGTAGPAPKVGFNSGTMGILAGVTSALMEYNSNSEKGMGTGENMVRSGSKGAGAGLGAWGGAAAGAAIGTAIFPGVGTAIGGLIGGGLGAWGGGELGEGVGNMIEGKPISDGILSGGQITPIDKKDDLMAYKPNGPIANNMKANQPANINITFSPLQIKCDELKVTSPGSPSLAIDLMKNPIFLQTITRAIHIETEKVVNGGKSKG